MKFPKDLFGYELYIRDNQNKNYGESITINKGETIDFGTYFNSFSPQKWAYYTTLTVLRLVILVNQEIIVTVYGCLNGSSEIIRQMNINCSNNILDFLIEDISKYQVLGIKIKAIENNTIITNIKYEGNFKKYYTKQIGIGICTFNREKYLNANISELLEFIELNSNFRISVSDNGGTITPCMTKYLRVYSNKNYGGSGGFTRAIIEEMNDDSRDYIILMDDDIRIDSTSLERINAFLGGLKSNFEEFIISGGMLQLDKPNYQVENTAFLGKIFLHSIGQYDVSVLKNLVRNEENIKTVFPNRYSGWWFSCLPVRCIKNYGLPLPLFIKGDDIEYSWRFGSNIITLNGVGVWHEKFSNKKNIVMDYFADRNMLLLQTVAIGTSRYTFLFSAFLRFLRRSLMYQSSGVRMFELAISDFNKGFEGLIERQSDIKLSEVRSYSKEIREGLPYIILKCFLNIFKGTFNFDTYCNNNKVFIKKYLKERTFWKGYLGLKL